MNKVVIVTMLFLVLNIPAHAETLKAQLTAKKARLAEQKIDDVCHEGETPEKDDCELITRDFNQMQAEFKVDICKPQKLSKKDCSTKFAEMMIAKFQLRYTYADWNEAVLWCKANPKDCNFSTAKGNQNFEAKLFETHNETIDDKISEINGKISHGTAAEKQRHKEKVYGAVSGFLKGVGDGMQNTNRPVNCTSSQYGNQVYTNCY